MNHPNIAPVGVFVGLTTFDLIYLLAEPIGPNQKQRALRYLAASGGPATNAAISFRALGGNAKLVSAVGHGTLGNAVAVELTELGVELWDTANGSASVPVSSILVQERTGDRAVISLNDDALNPDPESIDWTRLLQGVDVLMVDGHYAAIALAGAAVARSLGIPIVMDGGSWKPTSADVLHLVDIAICSEDFRPPDVEQRDVLDFVLAAGPSLAAVTRGRDPIIWRTRTGHGEVDIPTINVVDTLGSGDVLHGAFSYAIAPVGSGSVLANGSAFVRALEFAAGIASDSCSYFGTREWIGSLGATNLPSETT